MTPTPAEEMHADKSEKVVLEIFHEIKRAMLANDADSLKAHVAEDYQGCDAGGRSHGRDLMLTAYGPGGVMLETFEVSEVRTRSWANTVLVTGISWLRGSYDGQDVEHHSRFLDVYAHRESSWKLVASHITDIVDA